MKNDYNIDLKNLNFVLFTVYNVTSRNYVNNPPNPPYININDLIYYSTINYNLNNLMIKSISFFNKIKNYLFYKTNNLIIDKMNKILTSITFNNEKYNNIIEPYDKIDFLYSFIKDKFKSNLTLSSININIDIEKNDILSHITEITNLISQNNAATLIGTLETTDMLQSMTFDKFICSKFNDLDNILQTFKTYKLSSSTEYNLDIENYNNKNFN